LFVVLPLIKIAFFLTNPNRRRNAQKRGDQSARPGLGGGQTARSRLEVLVGRGRRRDGHATGRRILQFTGRPAGQVEAQKSQGKIRLIFQYHRFNAYIHYGHFTSLFRLSVERDSFKNLQNNQNCSFLVVVRLT